MALKGENSRLAKLQKPEFTMVNEDFCSERNAEFSLLSDIKNYSVGISLLTFLEPTNA